MTKHDKTPKQEAQPRTVGSAIAWIIPNATVFISSFCIMVIELLAGRIIAKHLGSSLYTWTSVIGVVLAGIAIGNYIGGRLADRYHAKRTLSVLFIISSAAAAAITVFDNFVGDWTALWTLSWPARVASHVTLVFFLPSAILGTISPVVAKMALDLGRQTGRTIGSVYAWGVVGSIFGTFMTGFYLIDAFGTTANVWAVASMLAFMALFYGIRSWMPWSWAAALIVLTVMGTSSAAWAQSAGEGLGLREPVDPTVQYEDESQYSYIKIVEEPNRPNIRLFVLDTLLHSQIDMSNPSRFLYEYERVYWCITKRLMANRTRANNLTIGGGGYVYPQHMHRIWPDSHTDVVEIDPAVTEAAMRYFGLPRDTSIGCFHEDGRVYVDQLYHQKLEGELEYTYDFIYCDAVNDYSVPYQLTTCEFMSMAKELLSPDGVYLMNMIDVYEEGFLLGSLIRTMSQVFPHVYVLVEGKSVEQFTERNTFIIAGTLQPLDITDLGSEMGGAYHIIPLASDQIATLISKPDVQLLTDEYAPVENLIAPVFCHSAAQRASAEWVREALIAEREDRHDEAIELLEEAIEEFPKMPELYVQLGLLHAKHANLTEAEMCFRRAISLKEGMVDAYASLGDVLTKLGRYQEAFIEYERVVKLAPMDTNSRFNYAAGLAEQGQLAEAAAQFEIVTKLDAKNAEAFNNWGVILVQMGQSENGAEKYREAIRIKPDYTEAIFNLEHTLLTLGQYEDSLSLCEQLLKHNPNDCQTRADYGTVLFRLKRYDEALAAFRETVKCNPNHTQAYFNIAILLDAMGDESGAIKACQEHLRIAPEDKQAQELLTHIQQKITGNKAN